MTINKTTVAKRIVGGIVGYGTFTIVRQAIRNNTETETIRDRVTVNSASLLAAYVAEEKSRAYTDAKIDEIVAWWEENVTNA